MATFPVYPFGSTANQILNIARQRVIDRVSQPQNYPGGSDPGQQFTGVGGGLESDDKNSDGSLIQRTQILFNSAYRKMQKYLGNLGYRLLIVDDFVVPSVPVNNNADPAIQTWISWNGNGLSDGTGFHATPALPADFYAPLKIRERLSGQNAIFFPMRCSLDGLRNQFVRTILNGQWEWRTNALFLPGANSLTDLQLRYIRFLPALPDPNYRTPNTPWYLQTLPIVGCESALAWYIAYEVLFPEGEQQGGGAEEVLQNAEAEADLIFNDQARADQRTNNRRRPRGGSSNMRGYGYGF